MKFKTYRVKVRRTRIVTDEMVVDVRARNKVNAARQAKRNYAPDTGSSKSKTHIRVAECKDIT